MRCYNAAMTARPSHGCYDCRRSASQRNENGLRRLLAQHGCEPYPDVDVEVYECEKCGGLWLVTLKPGCIMNLREEDAAKFFPSLTL